jgi:stalled ribosome rescue protein Dom34
MALELINTLTEISTRNLPWGKRQTIYVTLISDLTIKKTWEPSHHTNLQASMACYRIFYVFKMKITTILYYQFPLLNNFVLGRYSTDFIYDHKRLV